MVIAKPKKATATGVEAVALRVVASYRKHTARLDVPVSIKLDPRVDKTWRHFLECAKLLLELGSDVVPNVDIFVEAQVELTVRSCGRVYPSFLCSEHAVGRYETWINEINIEEHGERTARTVVSDIAMAASYNEQQLMQDRACLRHLTARLFPKRVNDDHAWKLLFTTHGNSCINVLVEQSSLSPVFRGLSVVFREWARKENVVDAVPDNYGVENVKDSVAQTFVKMFPGDADGLSSHERT